MGRSDALHPLFNRLFDLLFDCSFLRVVSRRRQRLFMLSPNLSLDRLAQPALAVRDYSR